MPVLLPPAVLAAAPLLPCVSCGKLASPWCLNNVDAASPWRWYELASTVTSCAACNVSRGNLAFDVHYKRQMHRGELLLLCLDGAAELCAAWAASPHLTRDELRGRVLALLCGALDSDQHQAALRALRRVASTERGGDGAHAAAVVADEQANGHYAAHVAVVLGRADERGSFGVLDFLEGGEGAPWPARSGRRLKLAYAQWLSATERSDPDKLPADDDLRAGLKDSHRERKARVCTLCGRESEGGRGRNDDDLVYADTGPAPANKELPVKTDTAQCGQCNWELGTLEVTTFLDMCIRNGKLGGGRCVADAMRAMGLPIAAGAEGIAANSSQPSHLGDALKAVGLRRYSYLAVRLHPQTRVCNAEHVAFTVAGLLRFGHFCCGAMSRHG